MTPTLLRHIVAISLSLVLIGNTCQAYSYTHTTTFDITVGDDAKVISKMEYTPIQAKKIVEQTKYTPIDRATPKSVHTYTNIQGTPLQAKTTYTPLQKSTISSNNTYQGITSVQGDFTRDYMDALRVFPTSTGRFAVGERTNTQLTQTSFGQVGSNAIRIGDNAIDWLGGKVGSVKSSVSEGGAAYNFSQDFTTQFKSSVKTIKSKLQGNTPTMTSNTSSSSIGSIHFSTEELEQPISQRKLVELLAKLHSAKNGTAIATPALPIIGDLKNEDTHYQYYVYVLHHGLITPSKATYQEGTMIYADSVDMQRSQKGIAASLSSILGKTIPPTEITTTANVLRMIKENS